ncbi:MAG: prepilin-type N-terminal cleavage/methylation domain-containing protein [bacterium]
MRQFNFKIRFSQACKKQAGFSVLEMIVVASIIMIGFMGILTLVEHSIKFRSMNQNYLIAVELANEGIELVRYVRNDNWLAFSYPSRTERLAFDYDINETGNVDGTEYLFSIDYRIRIDEDYGTWSIERKEYYEKPVSDVMDTEIKKEVARLYLDNDGNQSYIISKAHNVNDEPTNFYRLVKTIYDNNSSADLEDDHLYVISKVYWEDRGKDYYYTVSTYLYDYDWYY